MVSLLFNELIGIITTYINLDSLEILASLAVVLMFTGSIVWKSSILRRASNISDKINRDIQKALRGNLDFERLFSEVLTIIGNYIPYDVASIAAVDHGKSIIYNKYMKGKTSKVFIEIKLGFDSNSLYSWVVENKRAVFVRDVTKDDRYSPSIDTTLSEICIPIMAEGKVISVLNLESDKKGTYSEEHLSILDNISSILSVAYTNAILYEEVEKQRFASIKTLAKTLEASDPFTENHSTRVHDLAINFGLYLELSKRELEKLQYASILHDIGNIGVPSEILQKPGKLNNEEYDSVKKHSLIGYTILRELNFLSEVREIILQHHERIDGRGYPNGLRGDSINYLARILAILDAYESMTGVRPYRRAMGKEYAIKEIRTNLSRQFDEYYGERFIEFAERILA